MEIITLNAKSESKCAPIGWNTIDLDKLVWIDKDQLSGSTPPDFSFYYIDISSAFDGKLSLPKHKIQFKGAPSRARKVLHRGDIIMSTVRPNLKAFACFDHTDDKCIASTGFAVLTPKDGTYPKFILYSILSHEVAKQIDACVVGSNYPAINTSDVRKLKILTPKHGEQRKIAKILTTVDNVIEKTEALIAKYNAIKQGMVQDLFTHGVDENGELRPTYEEAPVLYKESKLGWIPKKWTAQKLSDISTINQGLQIAISERFKEYAQGRHLYITIQYLNNPESEGDTFYIEESNPSVMCKKEDILFVRTGNTGMIVTDIEGVFHNNFFKINYNRKKIVRDFLCFHLERPEIQILIMAYAGATTIPDLNHKDFYRLPFPCPPYHEQKRIADIVCQTELVIKKESFYVKKLKQIKSGLMQDLLTGNKRVKVDDIEEKAPDV